MIREANEPSPFEHLLEAAETLYRERAPAGWEAPASAAVAQQDGRVVAATDAGSAASLSRTIRAVAEYFDADWHPGDVALTNDVFIGASHPTEFTAVAPVWFGPFTGQAPEAWVAVRTDLPDIGGWALGGYSPSAMDVWAEGARIVPVKLRKAGKPRRELLEILALNSRTPRLIRACAEAMDAASGQLAGDVPAAGEGSRERFDAASDDSVVNAVARFRREIERLPDRTLAGEATVSAPPEVGILTLRVEIRAHGGRVEVEFPGAPPASEASINATPWMTEDTVVRALTAALGLDSKAAIGAQPCISLKVPPDSLLAADRSVPIGFGRAVTGRAVFLAVCNAVASAGIPVDGNALWPERAAHPGDGFIDPGTGRLLDARRAALEALEAHQGET